MSTSVTEATCGEVAFDRTMCSAIFWRMTSMGTTSIAPSEVWRISLAAYRG